MIYRLITTFIDDDANRTSVAVDFTSTMAVTEHMEEIHRQGYVYTMAPPDQPTSIGPDGEQYRPVATFIPLHRVLMWTVWEVTA